jgi:hypothetical protein
MKASLAIAVLIFASISAYSQLTVDEKNVSDDAKIKYIQLSHYMDKKTLTPVWLIDYGIPDVKDVNLRPVIKINGEELKALSPVAVLNKLYESGWEYMGDQIYTESFQMALHTYTLKRKD